MYTLDNIKSTSTDNNLRTTEFLIFRNSTVLLQVGASNLHFCTPIGVLPLNEYTHFELHTRGLYNYKPLKEYFGEYTLEGVNYFHVPKHIVEELLIDLQTSEQWCSLFLL